MNKTMLSTRMIKKEKIKLDYFSLFFWIGFTAFMLGMAVFLVSKNNKEFVFPAIMGIIGLAGILDGGFFTTHENEEEAEKIGFADV